MKTLKSDYGRIFAAEWSLYRKDHPMGEVVEKPVLREDVRFDREVKAGEVRLLADVVPTRTALVYKEQNSSDWMMVPVSDFSVPATDTEALIGRHVYQFWNARPVPRDVVERSWLTDRLDSDELKDVGAVLHHVVRGERLPKSLRGCLGDPLMGLSDYRIDYQCEFVIDEDSFEIARLAPVEIAEGGFDGLTFAEAAADSNQQANIVYNECDVSKSEAYPSCGCVLDQPFTAIRKDRRQRAISFSWDGELPEKWSLGGDVRVTAHDRKTRRQIGEGHLDLAAKEVVIDRFDGLSGLDAPIRNAADIVVVLTVQRKRG